ncbi:MAG: FRG domain-containing protein [Chloroflexi bacterium]|nr:FRG domain-containing protein [Chloroflexota bacterium]
MIIELPISSVELYISHIRENVSQWGTAATPWFRGEPESDTPLLPRLFRQREDGTLHNENRLLQTFRIRASSFSYLPTPDRSEIDKWLFLAQHVGLPTRLLDWTESALLALYFALKEEHSVVWMLNPHELNQLHLPDEIRPQFAGDPAFPLTWVRPKDSINIGEANIRAAWEPDENGLEYPVAVPATFIHPRMSAQRSAFTVHGADHRSMKEIIPGYLLRKFTISPDQRGKLKADLHMLGVNHSTAFPDLDGLAKELSDRH